ncbi:hypothetical protein L2Y90_19300 [Burkholderia pyrrocinia]|uniref:hypothetical protein n=1 Tax=Burkholderia pyrrocinia TaxID=60550 RepID=UPI00215A2BB8|nr:hypothetical protein [Burkholderia pyrrocinia]UVE68912.1 hypothetical protein L2Y90_19300 [Burkholderia pyrrocinia]
MGTPAFSGQSPRAARAADSEPVNEYQEIELNLPGMWVKIRARDATADTPARAPAQTSSTAG